MFIVAREQKWSIAPLNCAGQAKLFEQSTSDSVRSVFAPQTGHFSGTAIFFASACRFPSITFTT